MVGEKVAEIAVKNMCNGEEVGAAAEEWSPIREETVRYASAPAQALDFLVAQEDGASSDMDIEEEVMPLTYVKTVRRVLEVSCAVSISDMAGVADITDEVLDYSSAVERSSNAPTLKRKRIHDPETDFQESLRKSKKNFQDTVHGSVWHRPLHPSSVKPRKEDFGTGTVLEDITRSCTASVWIDRPLKQGFKNQDKQKVDAVEILDKEKEVPLYDRAFMSTLTAHDLEERTDGYISIEPEEPARCFNCGSYSHSLSNCSRSRDITAIRNARRALHDKRGGLTRLRMASRYYQSSPIGKFKDLKPGTLGPETRNVLGIGELDPPPWLNRMRELGYPPGYLEEEDDGTSGVKIIGDAEYAVENQMAQDVRVVAKACVDESSEVKSTCGGSEPITGKELTQGGNIMEKFNPVTDVSSVGERLRMTVEFPGINAPIPDNADKNLWAPPSESQQEKSSGSSLLPRSSLANNSGLSCMGEFNDARKGSLSNGMSVGEGSNYSRNVSDGMESYMFGNSHSLWPSTSPSDQKYVIESVNPAYHWSRRHSFGASPAAIEWKDHTSPRSSVQYFQRTPQSLSGLASPTRGMLTIPSCGEPLYSPSRLIYHSQHHSGPQRLPPPVTSAPNEAWLKAEAALAAIKSTK